MHSVTLWKIMIIDTNKAFAALKRSYIEGSFDRLDAIEALVTRLIDGSPDENADFIELTRQIHSLKGSAGVYGFMSVTAISHHLEDYLAASHPLSSEMLENVQIYLDQIWKIFETRENPSNARTAEILRGLPSAKSGNIASNDTVDATVLLVMEKGVLREMAAMAIRGEGFKLSSVDNALDAFKLIVTSRPDIVISSMEFPFLNGAELARVVRAMRATAKIPFVLLTSHSFQSKALEGLPRGVHLISKSDDHTGELVAYLKKISSSVQSVAGS